MHRYVLLALVLLLPYIAQATGSVQDTVIQKKVYTTARVAGSPPVIDGRLDDQAWNAVEWGKDFVEFEPDAGKKPARQTAVKVLYDDRNLYVAFKCFDDDPSKIVKRLGRRDNVDGDWAGVMVDSYYDHLTAFEFQVNAAGVIGDAYISNDFENEDYSWDPIWYVETSIDAEGWIAEMRIPLSQLRFSDQPEQVWGIEFFRDDYRTGELSMWQFVPKNAPGFVHMFGDMDGLTGLKPQKQLEIMPYTVGKIERSKSEEDNPFSTGSRGTFNAGLDVKIGLTSNFTLDLSVNPDFGQVEADPSVVNLTGFQNYFSEKRPFFVESNNILDYPVSQSIAWGSFNSDDLFYSRRIGHSPQGYPDLADGEYTRVPENTTILGAMKLTGKTQKGLSVGVLESITQRETARISDGVNERTAVVEPLTNYFESRILQDYDTGSTQIGAVFTAVNRNIESPEVYSLRKSAYTGGLDFVHKWKQKTWYVSGNVIFSKVNGSPEAMTATQTSQEHLFQRTTSGYVRVDSSLTSLAGSGATLKFGKGGHGNIQFQVGGTYKSPALELNDLGYLYKANSVNQFAWASYHLWNPWWIFNNFQANVNQWTNWDFGGRNLYKAANYNMNMQFKNFYSFGSGITYVFYRLDNDALRGGPSLRYPASVQFQPWIATDYRKKLNLQIFTSFEYGQENYMRTNNYGLWLQYKPVDYLRLSLNPGYTANVNAMQYVTNVNVGGQTRYIIGRIDQTTANLTARVSVSLTPDLSIEYYGQPFVSKGTYSDLKFVTNASAGEYNNRFHTYSANELSFDQAGNSYLADEDRDGQSDYAFDNPDFDFVQFRSNMVVRWEYKPGSTLFLVWSQSRTGTELLDDHSFGNLSASLVDLHPTDVFLVKFSYRFIR